MANREEFKPADLAFDLKQRLMDVESNKPQNQKIVLEMSMDIANGQLFQLEEASLIALREIAEQFQKGKVGK
ncbi:MAG: hypothetical protein GX295_08790 [Syntrophomonadaceae bacterium]|nr:hypothetical protein [Syntrophomonadaceae bacterium]